MKPVVNLEKDGLCQASPTYTASVTFYQDQTDCISHSTNTLGEGMNPIILPPAMGK